MSNINTNVVFPVKATAINKNTHKTYYVISTMTIDSTSSSRGTVMCLYCTLDNSQVFCCELSEFLQSHTLSADL